MYFGCKLTVAIPVSIFILRSRMWGEEDRLSLNLHWFSLKNKPCIWLSKCLLSEMGRNWSAFSKASENEAPYFLPQRVSKSYSQITYAKPKISCLRSACFCFSVKQITIQISEHRRYSAILGKTECVWERVWEEKCCFSECLPDAAWSWILPWFLGLCCVWVLCEFGGGCLGFPPADTAWKCDVHKHLDQCWFKLTRCCSGAFPAVPDCWAFRTGHELLHLSQDPGGGPLTQACFYPDSLDETMIGTHQRVQQYAWRVILHLHSQSPASHSFTYLCPSYPGRFEEPLSNRNIAQCINITEANYDKLPFVHPQGRFCNDH